MNYKKSAQVVVGLMAVVAIAFFFWFNSGSATLTWNANTEPDLAGYKIYYGTSARTGDCPKEEYWGGYSKSVDVGSNTHYSFKNFRRGATYYFSITSYDKAGNESCFSGESSKSIKY